MSHHCPHCGGTLPNGPPPTPSLLWGVTPAGGKVAIDGVIVFHSAVEDMTSGGVKFWRYHYIVHGLDVNVEFISPSPEEWMEHVYNERAKQQRWSLGQKEEVSVFSINDGGEDA